jgi:hypothetical protein
MFELFKIPFTYTVESSIGLYYDSTLFKTFPFTKESYLKMGASICEGTAIFVTALIEYENYLMERRRERKNSLRLSQIKRNYCFNTQCEEYDPLALLTVDAHSFANSNKKCLFLALLEEVKKLPEREARCENIDNDVSSDDHDDTQNL